MPGFERRQHEMVTIRGRAPDTDTNVSFCRKALVRLLPETSEVQARVQRPCGIGSILKRPDTRCSERSRYAA